MGTQTLDSFGLCEKDTYTEPDLFDRETLFPNTKEPGSENKSIEMYPLTKTHLASHLKMISDDDEDDKGSMAASSKFKAQTSQNNTKIQVFIMEQVTQAQRDGC